MCGIIGILGNEPAAPRIIEALKRLEYRGYDSAGVVTLDNGELYRARAPGKLLNLETAMKDTFKLLETLELGTHAGQHTVPRMKQTPTLTLLDVSQSCTTELSKISGSYVKKLKAKAVHFLN